MNINTVHMTGNLTDDPELRYTPSGKAVVSASIANNEHYTDAQGEEKKVTTFVNLQIWGKPAENFGNLVKKGQEIFIDGKIRMDEWTDKQTNTRRTRYPRYLGDGALCPDSGSLQSSCGPRTVPGPALA